MSYFKGNGDPTWFNYMVRICSERYGDKCGRFLAARIATVHRRNDNPCKSGERLAEIGIGDEMKKYNEIRDGGCCGFSDDKFIFEDHDDGCIRVFWYGFNFGH